ncbi:Uncharacterised protein [Mycobacteroides abscessus subsp. abscessus]|nr:Uncharacterised protein [Mycobacteroides abscessus subsp. abscessus]
MTTASVSIIPRQACICGPPGAIPAMMRWRIWRGGEFWWRLAASTGPAVRSMCAWRSPRPMNASMPQHIA